MFCPNCGVERVSAETSFCSRCGMPLGTVAEVIANGGYLPQLAQVNQKKRLLSKKNGVVFSIFWFIFFTMFCTSFFAILNAPEELVATFAITGVFGSMMLLIFSLVFLPSSKSRVMASQEAPRVPGQMAGGQQSTLPPAQAMPASAYTGPGGWRNTNDLEPSVTEGTTRLLDEQDVPNSR